MPLIVGLFCSTGQKLKSMNLETLRSSIGIVDQEPALFAMSIKENIRYGAKDKDFE